MQNQIFSSTDKSIQQVMTDMDLAVQKTLSDQRALSLLFLTFPKAQKVKKRSFGIKVTFA